MKFDTQHEYSTKNLPVLEKLTPPFSLINKDKL